MTPKYLLDTNILSEVKRPKPNANVMENVELHQQEIATATVVIHELLYGCFRLPASRKRQDLEDYINNTILGQLPVFDYDINSARYHAKERARLSKLGKTTAFVDGQIASIAWSNNLTVITNNIADFNDFEDLTLENWFT